VSEGEAEMRARSPISRFGSSGVLIEAFDMVDPVCAGEETEYLIRVTNQGPRASRRLQLSAECAPGLQPVSLGGKPEAVHGQSVRVPDFDLAPGATRSFRLKVKAVHPGDTRLRITLTGQDLSGPVVEEESTAVCPARAAARR
jgi:hypothetical protein